MVAPTVHVSQLVALLGEGLEGARGQVHCDIEEVHYFPIGLCSGDLQTVAVVDLVELVQHQLVLSLGEAADGEAVVAVQPDGYLQPQRLKNPRSRGK